MVTVPNGAEKQNIDREPDAAKWISMLWRKHPETYQHCVRVAILAEKIAIPLELSSADKDQLIRGCFLHDIGKAMIPRELVLQRAPLTRKQWDIIKMHPILGAEMVEMNTGLSGDILGLIRHHHERWDGRGYPEGLSMEQIPVHARICAVIDAFDSMLSDRPYGSKMRTSEAKLELLRHAGTQFDPNVVHAFMKLSDETLNIY
ncbi:putative nucleotidyltransferase with HDIG domain [Paenibacillus anaericanus]|nr:HD domain-containing phosphohydrolase [Paenibacillus anaericanus]MDQ0089350.1 putative nucleotidyltransferase with HDIG domain [Paenibacillus anaericanus]